MTNPRYKHFRHKIFTAGDQEQFISIIQDKRKNPISSTDEPDIVGTNHPVTFFKYGKNWMNTFLYIFNTLKKGIYVQIINNELNIFLPFSNVNYENHYDKKVFDVNPRKYSDFKELCKILCEKENRTFVAEKINKFTNRWYCNNGLVRYEFPIQENDSGIEVLYSMLESLCKERKIPDCEFFLNKRDFPMLKKDFSDPYEALIGHHSSLSWEDKSMIPIISMCSRSDFADLLFPTWEDWMRACYQHDNRVFVDYKEQFKTYPDISADTEWELKKSKIVFRGASTGLGVTKDTNPRLFFSLLAQDYPEILDVGITKWNLRPRKLNPDEYLDIIETYDLKLVDYLTPQQQSEYKYVLHLPGHSSAYRLSYELSMNCVIFMYPCQYNLWFSDKLKPYVHYIPLNTELTAADILSKYKWCEDHLEECKQIAKNARDFYMTHLRYDAVLDYCQNLLTNINAWMCNPNILQTYYNLNHENKSIYNKILEYEISDKYHIPIRETANTSIYGHSDISNRILKIQKHKQIFHEYFIGKLLNCVRCLTPSFIIVDKLYDEHSMTMEYNKNSISLDHFLNNDQLFSFPILMNIFQQIILSLHLAQKWFGFMHFDLCPWNIILFPNTNKTPLYFRFFTHDIELKDCAWIVKIIDFDKSHIVWNGRSFQTAIPFFRSAIHDIKCFWFHCASTILKKYKINKYDMGVIIQIIELLSGKKFLKVGDIKIFLSNSKKYSNLCLPQCTTSLFLKHFAFIFKYSSNNIIKCNAPKNVNIYTRVMNDIRSLYPAIEDDDQELCLDLFQNINQHDYLKPDCIDTSQLYPMISISKTALSTSQYDYVYKCIEFLQQDSSPTMKKALAQYFNYF